MKKGHHPKDITHFPAKRTNPRKSEYCPKIISNL